MKVTVEKLEDSLRKFNKDTEIYSSCGNCHHSTNGDLIIVDKTNQTYGYIELLVNNRKDPKIECAADKEEFFLKEIDRLKNEYKKLERQYNIYKDLADGIISKIELAKDYVEFEKL